MGLRDQARDDVGAILENATDFGQAISLTDPSDVTTEMVGHTTDISRAIDPESGMIVKGRQVYVKLRITSLPAGARPVAAGDLSVKPWRVSFPRITTAVVTQYMVVATDPDDSLGTIRLELKNYRA